MATEVYAKFTRESPSFIRRWSHKRRFEVALGLVDGAEGDILDFGTADAEMIRIIKKAAPTAKCYGYDPFLYDGALDVAREFPDVFVCKQLSELGGRQFATVLCLETLEHFTGDNLRSRVEEITALAAPQGKIIVSVPIEIGPTSAFKIAVRRAGGGTGHKATIRNAAASLVGAPVARAPAGPGGYIASHTGFDYRSIPPLFQSREWGLRRKLFSPFPHLGPLANSQIYFVFSRS